MALLTQDLLDIIDEIAPFDLAESWDNVGLLAGSPAVPVHAILIGLDPGRDLLDHALALGANVIITHHPLIFHPLKAVRTDRPDGDFLSAALHRSIQVIGCHTNLDAAPGGINDSLIGLFDPEGARPLVPAAGERGRDCGLGRIGRLRAVRSPEECIDILLRGLRPPWLLEAGVRPERVSTVAVCGGSGSEFARMARDQGADLYLTAEVKHDVACWARDAGFWIIDGGHYATEQVGLEPFCARLADRLRKEAPEITIDTAASGPPLGIIGT